MQIAKINFSFIEVEPDTENQLWKDHLIERIFHTEDDTLPEREFKMRMFDMLLVEFGKNNLRDANILSYEDLDPTFSCQV